MSSKNRGFAANLSGALDAEPPTGLAAPAVRSGVGVLTGRANRLAELASGSLVAKTHELVDPDRCRLWSEHNRDYQLLDEERCADLIESLKAQGRQEVPAIVRRIKGDPDFDFEVICGARRHWAVSWLRRHNYPEFRFLVEAREMTDEEAFRVSDLENRAREDLSDFERSKDYLRALARHYGGSQKQMAQRLNVLESWLSRYLDLARLPSEIVAAFETPLELRIAHIGALKPMLKEEETRKRVLVQALELRRRREEEGWRLTAPEVIRQLHAAAVKGGSPPKKSGSTPKRSGKASETVLGAGSGAPVLRVAGPWRNEVNLTLLLKGGATRDEAEKALNAVLEQYWKA